MIRRVEGFGWYCFGNIASASSVGFGGHHFGNIASVSSVGFGNLLGVQFLA